MNYEILGDILYSLPHNKHYLNRYIKFMCKCAELNKKLTKDTYTEKHHICPKAKDMFPELDSEKDFPWNFIKLTGKQHYLAHLILCKAYPTIEGAVLAYAFLTRFSKTSRFYGSYKATLNKANSKSKNKGKLIMTDGNKNYSVYSTDHVIKEKSLTHINKGFVSAKNDQNNTVKVLAEDFKKNDSLVGVTKGVAVMRDLLGNVISVSVDDPRILTKELVGINKNKITINNGKENKRIQATDIIPEGWIKGMVRPNGPKGKIWITNGIDSKMIKPEELIPEGWTKGRTVNKIWIHNYYESRQLDKHLPIPKGWVKGMIP